MPLRLLHMFPLPARPGYEGSSRETFDTPRYRLRYHRESQNSIDLYLQRVELYEAALADEEELLHRLMESKEYLSKVEASIPLPHSNDFVDSFMLGLIKAGKITDQDARVFVEKTNQQRLASAKMEVERLEQLHMQAGWERARLEMKYLEEEIGDSPRLSEHNACIKHQEDAELWSWRWLHSFVRSSFGYADGDYSTKTKTSEPERYMHDSGGSEFVSWTPAAVSVF
ncbi:hypothetical protein DXG01_014837 [Tephrocybe rancida]|nr:hypothetical protein DXG01_014837 [Tephrocybe rancida]